MIEQSSYTYGEVISVIGMSHVALESSGVAKAGPGRARVRPKARCSSCLVQGKSRITSYLRCSAHA